MKGKTWIPLVLAVVLGLAALKLTRDAMSRRSGDDGGADLVSVVTAARAIEPGQAITAEMLAVTRGPASAAPPGSFQSPVELAGRTAVAAVAEGAPVLSEALAPPDAGGVQALIPPGMRAITLRVDEFSGVAGLLIPGSRVDVIATIGNDARRGSMARTVVQNVEVRAVGRQVTAAPPPPQAGPDGEPVVTGLPPANNVTLLVTPQQAEVLQLASIAGTPWLVLRNAKDDKPLDSSGTSVAELRGDRTAPAVEAPVATVEAIKPVATADNPAAPQAPRSRTVRIIRATKEESVEVALPKVPERAPASPAPDEWLSNTERAPATGE